MTKEETNKIIKQIKAYYYYFDLDKDSLKIWSDKMLPYSYEDVIKRVEEHIQGEERQNPPRIQDLLRRLLTEEQKAKATDTYYVTCNLCQRLMPLEEYDSHYDKCLSIEYLVARSKNEGTPLSREQLENTKQDILAKLYEKYKPQEMQFKPQKMSE